MKIDAKSPMQFTIQITWAKLDITNLLQNTGFWYWEDTYQNLT